MALYNKYRSQRFADIKGQDTAVRILKSSLVKKGIDGVPQVMIFVGPHGTGKTSMAKIEAKVLNCENMVDGEPCGKCQSCLDIARDVSPCVTMLDAAANGDVAHVRDIIEDCKFVAAGNKKVYILDEVQMFSTAAWNALLKTLEEPPKDVFFILCTTESLKIAATAKSRCQEVLFKAITPDVIKEQLAYISEKEGIVADDEALAFIAESADGHMRDAISDLEKYSSYDRITKELILDDKGLCDEDSCRVILESILSGENAKGFETLAVLQRKGKDMKKLCGSLIRMITDSILGNSPLGFSEDLQVRLQKSLIAAYPNLSVPQAAFFLEAVLSSVLKEEGVIASLLQEVKELKENGVKVGAVAVVEENVVPFVKTEAVFDESEFLKAANDVYGSSQGIFDKPAEVVVRKDDSHDEEAEEAEPVSDICSLDETTESVSPVSKVPVKLYQIKWIPETEEKWYKSYDYIEKNYGSPSFPDYELVYEMDTDMDLDEIFMDMQDVSLPGYKGRSISVSDIIMYGEKYFYVDRIGFEEVWKDGPVTVEDNVPSGAGELESVSGNVEDVEMLFNGQIEEMADVSEEGSLEQDIVEEAENEESVSAGEPGVDIPEFDYSDDTNGDVTDETCEVSEERGESLVGKVVSYEEMIALAQGDIKASEVASVKEEAVKEDKSEDSILTMSFFDDFNSMFSFGNK